MNFIDGVYFTEREIDVIACLLNGRRGSAIASVLSIAPRTVTTHLRNIMLKLDCNSQDGIISFVEKTSALFFLRRYYSKLMTHSAFEKNLRELARQKGNLSSEWLCTYLENDSLKATFLKHLSQHLGQAGIKAKVQKSTQDISKKEDELLILLCHKEEAQTNFPEFERFSILDLTDQKDYYLAVFGIIGALYPNLNTGEIRASFEKKLKGLQNLPQEENQAHRKQQGISATFQERLSKKGVLLAGLCFLTATGLGTVGVVKLSQASSTGFAVRSVLPIPHEHSFLNRPDLLKKIEAAISEHSEIRSIALIGIGGAGKTTLARFYSQKQNLPVVWEINAETEQSLLSSFEKLADELATGFNEEKKLDSIKDIDDPKIRKEGILKYVKSSLKRCSEWLLLFDNVKNYSEVLPYLPRDYQTWGTGRIILTTRDAHMTNNSFIKHAIPVTQLSPQQKTALFKKIIHHREGQFLTKYTDEDVDRFLASIPSFPLDVSIAAHYLLATSKSPDQYLHLLSQNERELSTFQEEQAKSAGDYDKTRYSIITLVLQEMLGEEPDFDTLLLASSLLDSQNIPRDLLSAYTSEMLTDKFLYALQKYSLITDETWTKDHNYHFSIHRSTMRIMHDFIRKHLPTQKLDKAIQSFGTTFERYLPNIIKKEDLSQMSIFTSHCEMFLTHNDVVPSSVQAAIKGELGHIFYHMRDDLKAKSILEDSLSQLIKFPAKNYKLIVEILGYLANINMELGQVGVAEQYLDQVRKDFPQYFNETGVDIAKTIGFMGDVYVYIGNLKASRTFLEMSRDLYLLHPEDQVGYARVMGFLANAYWKMGLLKEALAHGEKSLAIYRERFPDSSIGYAWVLVYLGNIYHSFGNYNQALAYLQKAVDIYKTNFPYYHADKAWAMIFLGNLLIDMQDYQKAEDVLQESLKIHEKVFPAENSRIAEVYIVLANLHTHLSQSDKALAYLEHARQIFSTPQAPKDFMTEAYRWRVLGYHYFKKGDFSEAQRCFLKARDIFEANSNPRAFALNEDLACLYMEQATQYEQKRNPAQATQLKNQALNHLSKALMYLKTYYPEDSPHRMRVEGTYATLNHTR
ncbi:MAG: tetratricopeptide repeat protein [Alphaproteobacteria bacterium]|nr:tetratricopeptide repeat protein [Alphaproteobacteria bacterium]